MKKLLKIYASLALIILLSGCISFKSNKYPEIKSEDLKVSSAKKSKIFINSGFVSNMYGQDARNVVDKAKSDNKEMFGEMIIGSGCCDLVKDKDDASIVIDTTFYNDSSSLGLVGALLTGFSMYTIPSWMNSKMRISAKVSTGKVVNSYDVEDSALMIQWLPLILAMPFKTNPVKMEAEMNRNLYRHLLLKMQKDGVLN
jgi:hypothetical protein